MNKLNLKIALRNLWKNRNYTAINIFGLAVGLSGFLVILLYINYETGYDKWDPALKQAYSVGLHKVQNGAELKETELKGYFAAMVKEKFPEVENVSIGNWEGYPFTDSYSYNNTTFDHTFTGASIDSAFLKIYPIKPVYGRMEDLFIGKDNVAISLSQAKELFGDENPINKVLVRNKNANHKVDEQVVIKAVWDDKKYRSYFGFDYIGAMDFGMFGNEVLSSPYNTMIKLHKDANIGDITARLNEAYIKDLAKRAAQQNDNQQLSFSKAIEILKEKSGVTSQALIVEPVSDLNLNSYFSANPKQKTIYILTALATFLIIISCVNFTNLAIVQATGRAKEVGIKKVLGAYRFDLTKQFLSETAIQCIFAFFIALILTELLLPSVNELLAAKLALFTNAAAGKLLFQATCILLVIIFLSGLYPALFLSGFLPSKVLKGNFSGNAATVTLRKSLLIGQFTIAGGLIISFLIMNAQLNFMKNKDLGMKTDQVMVLFIKAYQNRQLDPTHFLDIRHRLENIKGVLKVSRSTDGLVGEGGFKRDFKYQGNTVQMITRYNDVDYLELLKVKLIAGRNFSEKNMASDTLDNIVINETAMRTIGLKHETGQIVTLKDDDEGKKYTVIGIIKDIQNEGFDKEIKPTVYLAGEYQWRWRKNILLQLSGNNISQTIAEVKKTWKEIEPDYDPAYSFVDEKFAKLNAAYERMSKIMFSFSALTLLVSVLGLFSLAAYNAKIRVKEIAVRKILGASTASILKLLNSDLVRLVIIANVLGDVFAWIYMNQWFKTFAYRIDMPVFPFLLVNIGTILITILTVSLQSMKAVKANPAVALKYE